MLSLVLRAFNVILISYIDNDIGQFKIELVEKRVPGDFW